jgi:hypothetical protein
MPRELHRHALGHRRAHKVARGRPTKIMRDAARTAGLHPRLAPRLVESPLGHLLPRFLADQEHKHRRREDARACEPIGDLVLIFQHTPGVPR